MTKSMNATLVVTAIDGTVWSGEVNLTVGAPPRSTDRKATRANALKATPGPTTADLKVPARAFFKAFASRATAAGRFALVIAQITQGTIGKEVHAVEIEKVWNQNRGVLGGAYQSMYATRAKESGWVESTKRGVYFLVDGWQKAANG